MRSDLLREHAKKRLKEIWDRPSAYWDGYRRALLDLFPELEEWLKKR